MKKRFTQKNFHVKQKKRGNTFAVLGTIHRVGTGFLRIFLLFAVVTLISVGFVSLYHYLIASPYMKLEQVKVEGVDEKVRRELIQICGLHSDLSLLALNLNALQEKMKKHPWVRSINLERLFPNTLIVKAEKETAWALVVMDKIYYMNPWGEVFKEVEDSETMDLPVITGVSKQGSEIRKQLEKVTHLMKLLESEQGMWSLNELSEIHMNEYGGMSIYFNRISAEIKLACEDLTEKIEGLKKVTKHLAQTGRINQVIGIDLNQVDGAVVSFKST